MELSRPNLKKLLIFQEETFQGRKIKKTLKKFLLFWEMELSSPKLKKLIFFSKKAFLHFRRELRKPKKRNKPTRKKLFIFLPKKVFLTCWSDY